MNVTGNKMSLVDDGILELNISMNFFRFLNLKCIKNRKKSEENKNIVQASLPDGDNKLCAKINAVNK